MMRFDYNIKELNTKTQRSGNQIQSINIMPYHELVYNDQNTAFLCINSKDYVVRKPLI